MKRYSKTKITKAGKQLEREEYSSDAELDDLMDVLSFWRFDHEEALNDAFNLLKKTALNIDKKAIFGRRLKRYTSIVRKLKRFDNMQLANMRDVGGCRVIVSGEKKLEKVVRALKSDRRFKNADGSIRRKDYIRNPKLDGYRSYHLTGKFNNTNGEPRFIEVQVRTIIQHDWATTLEVVDLFTGQALKSNMGEESWKEFFVYVGEQFSLMDSIPGFTKLDTQEQFNAYSSKLLSRPDLIESCARAQVTASKVNAIEVLDGFAQSLKIIEGRLDESNSGGYILVKLDVLKRELGTEVFLKDQSEDAEKKYTALETEFIDHPHIVVALISTATVNDIRDAYPNFFGDSRDFIKYLSLINMFEIGRARPNSFLRFLTRAGLSK